MKRDLGLLLAALALAPAVAAAVDAPHDGSFTSGDCQACHRLHNAAGGTLTSQPDNNTLCASCHDAAVGSRRGFPWVSLDQARPGVGGIHHRWDGFAVSPAHGAATPSNPELAQRIDGGRLQCATCHDQHAANKGNARGPHTSIAVGTATAPTGGTGGTNPTMTLQALGAGASARGYRVRVARVAGSNVEVVVSNDFSTATPTWWNWNGSAWVVGVFGGNGLAASLRPQATAIPLTDGANVQVAFGGTLAVGRTWDFYVSFPFLRMSAVGDAICLDCHAVRNQTFTDVRGANPALPADGVTVFSHPVGVALNANGRGYDRAAPLDANGGAQGGGSADTLATNDLALDGTVVRCTTCHAVHNVDSNSLTEDPK
jgi:predicted CXXCH cytochrome family protein